MSSVCWSHIKKIGRWRCSSHDKNSRFSKIRKALRLFKRKRLWFALLCTWVFGLAIGTGIAILAFYQLHKASNEMKPDSKLYHDIGILQEPRIEASEKQFLLRPYKSIVADISAKSFGLYGRLIPSRSNRDPLSSMGNLVGTGSAEQRKEREGGKTNNLSGEGSQQSDDFPVFDNDGFQFISSISYGQTNPTFIISLEQSSSSMFLYRLLLDDGAVSSGSTPIILKGGDTEHISRISPPSMELISIDSNGNKYRVNGIEKNGIFEVQHIIDLNIGDVPLVYNKLSTLDSSDFSLKSSGKNMLVRIRSQNNSIISDWSELIYTPQYVEKLKAPLMVSDLKIESSEAGRLVVTWKESRILINQVQYYLVNLIGNGKVISSSKVNVTSNEINRHEFKGLEHSTEYTVSIHAVNAIGSGKGTTIKVRTQGCSPSPPSDFKDHIIALDGIILVWNKTEGNCPADHWRVTDGADREVCTVTADLFYCEANLTTGGQSRRLKIQGISMGRLGRPSGEIVINEATPGHCNTLNTRSRLTTPHPGGFAKGHDPTLFQKMSTACAKSWTTSGVESCVTKGLRENPLSFRQPPNDYMEPDCLKCGSTNAYCAKVNCWPDCVGKSCSPECQSCIADKCTPHFMKCSGLISQLTWSCE